MIPSQAFRNISKNLYPSYFSMVMATGILAIAAHLLNIPLVAKGLGYFNSLIFAVLLIFWLVRLIFYFAEVKNDLCDFRKSPGFFTFVAALSILGHQSFLVFNAFNITIFFLILSAVSWLLINYTFFHLITIREIKPSIDKGIDGSWLLIVVAIQSLSSLIAGSIDVLGDSKELIFISICLFLTGCILYLIFITLIFYRLTFFKVNAFDFEASYWINMGATAISTLAGTMLVFRLEQGIPFQDLTFFLKGITLLNWSIASWWIPILILFGIWKHLRKKIPFPHCKGL